MGNDKLEEATEKVKKLKTVTIPEAENDVKQAETKAASTKKAAEDDRSAMETAAENAKLDDKLAENAKEFYADTADHQASRMDGAKEVLDSKKEAYEHYNDELQKANAGGVVELSY